MGRSERKAAATCTVFCVSTVFTNSNAVLNLWTTCPEVSAPGPEENDLESCSCMLYPSNYTPSDLGPVDIAVHLLI